MLPIVALLYWIVSSFLQDVMAATAAMMMISDFFKFFISLFCYRPKRCAIYEIRCIFSKKKINLCP